MYDEGRAAGVAVEKGVECGEVGYLFLEVGHSERRRVSRWWLSSTKV